MTRRTAGASAPTGSARPRPALPLRWGLAAMVAAVLVSFAAVALLTMSAASSVAEAETRLALVTQAQEEVSRAAAGLERARADLAAALATGVGGSSVSGDIAGEIDDAHAVIEEAGALDLPRALAADVATLHEVMDTLSTTLDVGLSRLDGGDPTAAKASLLELRRVGSDLQASWDSTAASLASAATQAQADLDSARTSAAVRVMAGAAGAALLVLGVGLLVVTSVRKRLRLIAAVATQVGEGDLEARASVRARDEIGRIAQALNAAVTVQRDLVEQLETEAERVKFAGAVAEAFEMVDREPGTYDVVGQAFARILPGHPAEFLLADSSRAHLRTATATTDPPPPSCPVEAPYDCVAVRRGSAAVFPDSHEINACPKLRERDCGPCSAACVPVSFMGRALGVLHATGPVGADWDAEKVALLAQVGSLAGSRIGTIRTFERTQVQASTDGLTGLANRRAFETEARRILHGGQPITLALLDLDHFKLLNDTYGHEAGDRALRAFARIVASGLRDGDLAARVGGEEFTIVLPHTDVKTAGHVLDRIRSRLVETASGDAPPVTVSAGLVVREDGDSLDDLLRYADRALYRAKENGRNRVEVAGPEDRTAAARPEEERWSPVVEDHDEDAILPTPVRTTPLYRAAIDDQDRSPDDQA
ncbi:MAG: diguanylate cyclase [Candidatus Nanopelagicales bacterium]